MIDDELRLELEALKRENANLKAQKHAPQKIYFKVGEKGGISLYGLNRFPVTLYKEQWDRLIASVDELKEFMAVNLHKLKLKDIPPSE